MAEIKIISKEKQMPKLVMVAAYARVSSDKDAMLHSLSSQVSYFSKMIQAKYLQAFIDDLEKRPNVLEAYDEDIWSYLIDKAVVSRDGSITFNFRNGKKIRID